MANDTKVAILGYVPVSEVIHALELLGDTLGGVSVLGTDVEVKPPTSHPKTTTVNGLPCSILYRGGKDFHEYGFINITLNGVNRNIFYHYSSRFVLNPDAIELNLDYGLPEFNQPFTTLSLGMDSDAITLLRELAYRLDGYIDEDDCDNQYYHKVQ